MKTSLLSVSQIPVCPKTTTADGLYVSAVANLQVSNDAVVLGSVHTAGGRGWELRSPSHHQVTKLRVTGAARALVLEVLGFYRREINCRDRWVTVSKSIVSWGTQSLLSCFLFWKRTSASALKTLEVFLTPNISRTDPVKAWTDLLSHFALVSAVRFSKCSETSCLRFWIPFLWLQVDNLPKLPQFNWFHWCLILA